MDDRLAWAICHRSPKLAVDTWVPLGLVCSGPGTALQATPARRGVDAADVTEAVLGDSCYSQIKCLGVAQYV